VLFEDSSTDLGFGRSPVPYSIRLLYHYCLPAMGYTKLLRKDTTMPNNEVLWDANDRHGADIELTRVVEEGSWLDVTVHDKYSSASILLDRKQIKDLIEVLEALQKGFSDG
jgi:hypothetical protein